MSEKAPSLLDLASTLLKAMKEDPSAAEKLEKSYRNLKGVHTSGGFSGLESKGQSQAGRNIERSKEPQPNKYLGDLYHERGKQMHREKLQELKQMPKPKLTKEQKKDQKGVHQAHFGASARGTGTSEVGAFMSPDGKNSPQTMKWAKEKHKQVLGDLKSMPKPKLTKEEFAKDEMDYQNFKKARGAEKERRKVAASKEMRARGLPKYKMNPDGKSFGPDNPHAGHRYGINPQSKRHKPGVSVVGGHIRDKANPVIPLKEQRQDHVRHLKEASKPNLPKAELQKDIDSMDKFLARQRNKPRLKGVHEGINRKTGTSHMGLYTNPESRKRIVREKTAESRQIRPNLPKQEPSMSAGSSGFTRSGATASNPVSRPDAGFGKITVKAEKKMHKDDKPHPPNSAKDIAHDVVEEGKPLKSGLATSPDKKDTLQHLRNAKGNREQWTRSPRNRLAGKLMMKYEPRFSKKDIPAEKEIKPVDKKEK